MKTTFLISLLATGACCAEFEKWTNKDGKTAELELIKVTETSDGKAGEFKMRNGRRVTLKASDLAEADATRLAAWEPPAEAATGKPSVFDEILDGNLVKLDGKSLKRYQLPARPTKYYIFYYTASWCGPCQKYTPGLVEFYNKHKEGNDKFELVLISSDQEEDAMEGYAKEKSMPWPQLKLGKVKKFEKDFDHGVTGIPTVVVCDLGGEIIAKTQSLAQLENLVK